MKIIKTIVFAVVANMVIFSCGNTTNEPGHHDDGDIHEVSEKDDHSKPEESTEEGYLLYKKHCTVCHGGGSSHDNIIAPPMVAVKRHYYDPSISKAEFAENIVNWVKNPTEDKVQMPGAVNKFKIMPKLGFSDNDVMKIAFWLYDNEPPKPEWFDQHESEEHGGNQMEDPKAMGNAWKSEIALNKGKKWAANKETTTGMVALLNLSNKYLEMEKIPSAKVMHKEMKEEISMIINECSMDGPSHDNLHIYLLPLIHKIDKLEEIDDSSKMSKNIVEKIKKHLEEYDNYFE